MSENNLTLNSLNFIENKNDEINFTLIQIGNKKYALKTTYVQEIIKVIELAYPHQMPACVLGILKYIDKPIGIIDLRQIFKKERLPYSTNSKIIITQVDNNSFGIICDNVVDIKKLKIDKVKELPYQKDAIFYDGLYIDNEENIYILNIENIKKYVDNCKEELQEEREARKYIASDEYSKEILKERKEELYRYNGEETEKDTSLYDRGVSFSINKVKYYINLASIKEFYRLNKPQIIHVPNCPKYIMGLINIKGEYICVLDIRCFYKSSPTQIKEKSTLIILNSQEYKLGILADEICENMNINFEELTQNRKQKQDDNKMLEFVKNDEIYQIIDTEKLFQDKRLTIC